MKFVILLGDGMADYPLPELDNKTPLQAAFKPRMDFLARHGMAGMARTIPKGMPPGSDTANLSVMGYAPAKYYSGRSPLEAASLGVDLADDDVSYRCNLVTLSDEPEYADKTMVDYGAGEISTEEAAQLIKTLAEEFTSSDMHLYPGISYRHCLVLSHEEIGAELTPPHDISGRNIGPYLPQGRNNERFLAMQKRSYELLKDHSVNKARMEKGLNPANSIWLWGEGVRPRIPSLESLYGVKGGVVCAVDLIRGLGRCAGLRHLPVAGATGGMVTDYAGKGRAALQLLKEGCDLVYIHVEAPDECGHHGDIQAKIAAIEAIDRELLIPLMDGLEADGEDYSILLTPDHPTPIPIRTHTDEPVPFALYRSNTSVAPHASGYSEVEATATGLYLEEGPQLIRSLLGLPLDGK